MRITEKSWGIIYLISAIFAITVSIWDFPIFYARAHILLFSIYVILILIFELIFSFLFIRLSVKSFRYARNDLDEEESTNRISKIFVLLSNIFQVGMIIEALSHI